MNLPAIHIEAPESSKQSDQRFTHVTRQNISEIDNSAKAPKKGQATDIYMLVIFELITTAKTVIYSVAIKSKAMQSSAQQASVLEKKLDQLIAKPLPKPSAGKTLPPTVMDYYNNQEATINKERAVLSAEITLEQNVNQGRQGAIEVNSTNVDNAFHETSVLIGMVQHITFNANLTKPPRN